MISYNGINMFNGVPCIEDIAISLGRQCRWNGHCHTFWSVLAHSLAVSDILPGKYKLWGLMHDSAESVVSDIPTPVKTAEQNALESYILKEIYKCYAIPWPSDTDKYRIKQADEDILRAECVLFGPPGITDLVPEKPSEDALVAVQRYWVPNYPLYDCCEPEGELVKLFVERAKSYLALELERV